jgi:hypothetical protein
MVTAKEYCAGTLAITLSLYRDEPRYKLFCIRAAIHIVTKEDDECAEQGRLPEECI